MTRAVIEERMKALRAEFIEALGDMAELLDIAYEKHAVEDLKYKRDNK